MEITWLDSMDLKQKVKEELIRGHELANQLRMVVRNGDDESTAKDFAKHILSSFTTSLSLLSVNHHEYKREHIQVDSGHSRSVARPIIVDSSSYWDTPKPIRSKKMPTDHGASSTRKRKDSHPWRWSRDATDLVDDGNAWRKYGQKQILKSSHPRNYYRCSHKYDQGCTATKHVQKLEDDPSLYRITYIGNHTCNHNLFKSPNELIIDGSYEEESNNNSKFMLTFGNTNLPYEQERPILSSSSSMYCDYLVQHEQQAAMFESSENVQRLPEAMTELQPDVDMEAMMECFARDIVPML